MGSQHLRVYGPHYILWRAAVIRSFRSKVIVQLLDPIAALLLWIQLDTSWIQVLVPMWTESSGWMRRHWVMTTRCILSRQLRSKRWEGAVKQRRTWLSHGPRGQCRMSRISFHAPRYRGTTCSTSNCTSTNGRGKSGLQTGSRIRILCN